MDITYDRDLKLVPAFWKETKVATKAEGKFFYFQSSTGKPTLMHENLGLGFPVDNHLAAAISELLDGKVPLGTEPLPQPQLVITITRA